MGLQLSRLTSPAPDAAANKAPGSWQGTQPSPRAPESSWHCMQGRGAPPHSHSSRDLPTPSLASPGHSCFPRALHIPNRPSPKEAPPPAQSRAYSASGTLPRAQVGEFINILGKALSYLIAGMKRFPMKPNTRRSPPREWKL